MTTFLLGSTSGRLLWQYVISRFTLVKYLRCSSLFMTCATFALPIFSRPYRAWIPTMVTPIGHAALPMAKSM